jgi:hypothetical protein
MPLQTARGGEDVVPPHAILTDFPIAQHAKVAPLLLHVQNRRAGQVADNLQVSRDTVVWREVEGVRDVHHAATLHCAIRLIPLLGILDELLLTHLLLELRR